MVFQHFSLFEALTVAENIALSLDDGIADRHDRRKGAGRCPTATACRSIPMRMVGDLSVGERQRIEIVRCLLQNPQLIILDEPTSVLTPQEADKLFETLERLRAEGKSILYIRHRLEEVQRICDRATVLRHGKVVGDCDPRQETAASLARMMVGSEVAGGRARRPGDASRRTPLLEIRNLSRRPRDAVRRSRCKDISLDCARRRGDRHRRCRRQRPGRALRCGLRRSIASRMPSLGSHPRQGRRAASASPAGGCWAPPSCRRSASAMVPLPA